MIVFYVLGGVVCVALIVVINLFFQVSRSEDVFSDEKAVPINDISEFKKSEPVSQQNIKPPIFDSDQSAKPSTLASSPQESQEMIDMLEEENERSRNLEDQWQQEKQALEARLKQIEEDLDKTQVGLKQSNAEKKELEESLALSESRLEEKSQQQETIIAQLRQELQEKPVQVEEVQVAPTQESDENLEEKVRDLQQQNDNLHEANQTLEYDLAKSHAQILGLERVCDNFKVQLQDLFDRFEMIQRENTNLLTQKSGIEDNLELLKGLNRELLKREKLSQFELEDNRAQIHDLESIFQNFKSRISKVDWDVPDEVV